MIDLRAARHDPDTFRTAIARKGAAEAFDALLSADEQWRGLVPRVDDLRSRQKVDGRPTPEQIEELKRVKEELRALEEQLASAEAARDELVLRVPNPPHESVPDGVEEEDAQEIRRVGEPPQLDDPKEHTEIGRFDMERAARLAGSRFGYFVGDTAALTLALYRFALDRIAAKGFTPILPPVLVREEALIGTGHFPAGRQDVYAVADDELYLAGTAEIPVASLHAGEILSADELPLRYVAFSPCFRREAGAAGRDTRGMFRVHQFNKVEQFSFTQPEESWDELERLLANTEELARDLGLEVPVRGDELAFQPVQPRDIAAPGDGGRILEDGAADELGPRGDQLGGHRATKRVADEHDRRTLALNERGEIRCPVRDGYGAGQPGASAVAALIDRDDSPTAFREGRPDAPPGAVPSGDAVDEDGGPALLRPIGPRGRPFVTGELGRVRHPAPMLDGPKRARARRHESRSDQRPVVEERDRLLRRHPVVSRHERRRGR
jgi:seryl-tRNA synthetase